ncbi:hypothetical protein [Streptomyces ziwulingensis]|uniref:Secreted protein n=1 Tax=Streptomyces ziwulingensis TaxID=1045501 RepID=A0ABP9AYC8_9ACTN
MSAQENESVAPPTMPALPDAPATAEAEGAAALPSGGGRRRRSGRIAAVAVVAAAVVTGVGYTVVTVSGADRDAGAPVWKLPKATAVAAAPAPKGLDGVLVPYRTDGWMRGPDLGEFGSDAKLSGARATALQKESLRALPRTARRQMEKEIDRRDVKGMVMRSYVSGAASWGKDMYTASIVLAQMNRTAARDLAHQQSEFAEALDLFRDGPEVEGHENAECWLPPEDDEADLDSMLCSAYAGDVLVTLSADGVKPWDTESVTALLAEQLDRIAEPGEAV